MASPLGLIPLSLQASGWKAYARATTTAARLPEMLDLDADGREECLELRNGILTIRRCDDTSEGSLWQSPSDWQVKEWTVSDLNHDGRNELALLVWRQFSPWPVDPILTEGGGRINSFHDAAGNSCHVILIGWRNGRFGELWAGSALFEPVISLAAADMDGDGAQELVTVEGKYQDSPLWRSGPLAIWKWNGFGFDLSTRIGGAFRHVKLPANHPGWMILSQ